MIVRPLPEPKHSPWPRLEHVRQGLRHVRRRRVSILGGAPHGGVGDGEGRGRAGEVRHEPRRGRAEGQRPPQPVLQQLGTLGVGTVVVGLAFPTSAEGPARNSRVMLDRPCQLHEFIAIPLTSLWVKKRH